LLELERVASEDLLRALPELGVPSGEHERLAGDREVLEPRGVMRPP
jgi:hypothetical protein